MNAIELLEQDHKIVEELFGKVESAQPGEHPRIFKEIKAELEAHAHVEETVFYPSLQDDGDEALVELVSEALKEHAQAKVFLGELDAVVGDASKFDPLLTKLIQDVRHHVEEEEGEMFPMVEAQFEEQTLDMWGEQIQAEKDRFEMSAESAYA